MKHGFGARFSLPPERPSDERLKTLEANVVELWELLDMQEGCHEDICDVLHDVEHGLRELRER